MSALPVESHPHESRNVVAPSARSGLVEIAQSRAVAEVQAAMIAARKFPRDEIAARDKIVNAFARPALAEVSKYSYARGGTDIEGPSIHALQAVARLWGNIHCGVEELSRSAGQSECRAYALDLETGFKDEKTFVVRHVRDTKQGPKVLTEERDLYELIANMGARRKRACLEAVIPDDVVEDAMRQAEVTLKTKFDITPEYISSLLGAFEKFGVTKQQIEARIQRHIDAMTPAQAVQLKKIHTSLKDGMSKPEDWFEKVSTEAGEQPSTSRTEDVKEKLRAKGRPAQKKEQELHPAAAATGPAAPGAPPAYTDDAQALLAIDRAQDEGEASAVVDRCKGQPFYGKVAAAYNERFSQVIE